MWLGEEEKIEAVPLSNDTIYSRIADMSFEASDGRIEIFTISVEHAVG